MIIWRDRTITIIRDVRDIILSIDDDDELKDFVQATAAHVPVTALAEMLIAASGRSSPESSLKLGVMDVERLQQVMQWCRSDADCAGLDQ